jgi:hypothetical protein
MNNKTKNKVVVGLMAAIVLVFTLLCLFLPKPEFLDSERREPAKFPELTIKSIMKDGAEYATSFMKLFDDKYTPDNFPFRDFFRNLKAWVGANIFAQKDKDGVFVENGYAAEMQEQINADSIAHAAKKLEYIYEKFLKPLGIDPYISIIPDKAYFLAEQNGYLSMDYEQFIADMLRSVQFTKYISIIDYLSVEDYYMSDTHWRQEKLVGIAKILVDGMGGNHDSKYTVNTLDTPFYGVYSGRAPKPLKSETLYYLTNDNMKDIVVKNYEQGGRIVPIYDMDKGHGKDAYDIYLGGERSYITIENPNAKTDKELVIFRDSFGRSIIPLMMDDYAKITVVDIRYMSSMMLGNLGIFKEGQDVLFLYSTLILNNSSELK